MKRKRRLRGNRTIGKKKALRVKAGEMGRTGVMGERMFEIKRKQSYGRDGQIDNMKQQQREEGEEELGHKEKGDSQEKERDERSE